MTQPPPDPSPAPLAPLGDEDKAWVRRQAVHRRQVLARAVPPHVAGQAAALLLERVEPGLIAGTLGLYWPLEGEIDPRPVARLWEARRLAIALPVVVGRGQPMVFRLWDGRVPTARDAMRVPCPDPTAPELRPDLVLVPMLAFDGAGHRLGYGAGYYDRTLAALRGDAGPPIVAVGLAYADQEVRALPAEAHDQRLDWMLTERALRRG